MTMTMTMTTPPPSTGRKYYEDQHLGHTNRYIISGIRTRLVLGLALSLITHETVGKSLLFWASLHFQGISSAQNGGKHPGLQSAQFGNFRSVFFSIQNKN